MGVEGTGMRDIVFGKLSGTRFRAVTRDGEDLVEIDKPKRDMRYDGHPLDLFYLYSIDSLCHESLHFALNHIGEGEPIFVWRGTRIWRVSPLDNIRDDSPFDDTYPAIDPTGLWLKRSIERRLR